MKNLKQRRREYKTDYKKRISLLKGRKPRIVFRRTNRYIIAQYIESKGAKDRVVLTINSKELLKYGWPKNASGSLKSIPANYLTGYLIGKQIILKKLENPIVDFGMLRVLHKTKIYGFLKGLIDSGIKIECDKKYFPEDNKIKGEQLKNKIQFEEIKLKIEKLK